MKFSGQVYQAHRMRGFAGILLGIAMLCALGSAHAATSTAAVTPPVTPVSATKTDHATSETATAATAATAATTPADGNTASAASATSTPQHAPGPGLAVGALFQTVLGLVLVIGMILLCAWFTRRMGMQPNSSTQLIRIRASASLGQRQRLVVVEVGGQCLLLGVTPQNITTLESFPAADLPVNARASAPDIKQFSQALSSKIRDVLNKRPPQ